MTEEARIRVVHHAVLPVLMVTADTAEVTVGQDRFHVSTKITVNICMCTFIDMYMYICMYACIL